MPTTSNFGWTTPADTDLVKDGAAAIRTLGNGIDTSLVDLKGGTTNQVLAKNSNTDLDFKWVADASGIPATIFDAKGDIIAATAADTADRLAVGTNGHVLTADSSTATGLKWAAVAAGGMTLLSTTTLSGASTTVSSISGSYTDLYIVITGMQTAANSYGVHFDPNGSTSISSAARVQSIAGTGTAGGYDGATIWVNQSGDFLGSNSTNGFVIYIYDYASANPVKNFKAAMSWFNSSSQRVTSNHMGGIATSSAISSFTATTDASSFNAGTIKIYGVK